MNSIYLPSINQTIVYNGMIEESDLQGILLSKLSNFDLDMLIMCCVGYAETMVEFEIESRFES